MRRYYKDTSQPSGNPVPSPQPQPPGQGYQLQFPVLPPLTITPPPVILNGLPIVHNPIEDFPLELLQKLKEVRLLHAPRPNCIFICNVSSDTTTMKQYLDEHPGEEERLNAKHGQWNMIIVIGQAYGIVDGKVEKIQGNAVYIWSY